MFRTIWGHWILGRKMKFRTGFRANAWGTVSGVAMPDSLGGVDFSMPFLGRASHNPREVGSLVVVGAGRMGSLHLSALDRGGLWRLAGVFDRQPGHASPGKDTLEDWLEERKPDAAIVAVPPESHESVARICLASGCHVLLEKPLCPSSACARELAEEFTRSERVLFGGHTERFNPVFLALGRELGRIGGLVGIRTWRVGPAPHRVDAGGVVLDLAIHDLDLVQRLAKGRAELESAVCPANGGAPSEMRASLRIAGVPTAVFAQWAPERRRGIRLTGTNGILEADLLARSLSLRTDSDVSEIDVAWSDPLESEHAAFAAACRGEIDSRRDLEFQIHAIELAEAILRSGS